MLLYTYPEEVKNLRYSYDKFNVNATKRLLSRYKLLYGKNITESTEPKSIIGTGYVSDIFLGAEGIMNHVPKARNKKTLIITHMRKGNLGANPFNSSYFIINIDQQTVSIKNHRNLLRRPMLLQHMSDGIKLSEEFPKKIESPLSRRNICTTKKENGNGYIVWYYNYSPFVLYAKTITVKLGFLKSRFNDKWNNLNDIYYS